MIMTTCVLCSSVFVSAFVSVFVLLLVNVFVSVCVSTTIHCPSPDKDDNETRCVCVSRSKVEPMQEFLRRRINDQPIAVRYNQILKDFDPCVLF